MWYKEQAKRPKVPSDREAHENQTIQVAKISTLEAFCRLANALNPDQESETDFSFFKEGIMPSWEDAANKEGGRWIFQSSEAQSSWTAPRLWNAVLQAMAGELFDETGDQVCGVVLSRRSKRGDRMELWTRSSVDAEARAVGVRFLTHLFDSGLRESSSYTFAFKNTATTLQQGRSSFGVKAELGKSDVLKAIAKERESK